MKLMDRAQKAMSLAFGNCLSERLREIEVVRL